MGSGTISIYESFEKTSDAGAYRNLQRPKSADVMYMYICICITCIGFKIEYRLLIKVLLHELCHITFCRHIFRVKTLIHTNENKCMMFIYTHILTYGCTHTVRACGKRKLPVSFVSSHTWFSFSCSQCHVLLAFTTLQ